MSAADLQLMIEEITKDIRLLQTANGGFVVFDPTSEAYRLVEVRLQIQRKLEAIRGW